MTTTFLESESRREVGRLGTTLSPLEGEGLFGFSLRHDLANGLLGGTLLCEVARHTTGARKLADPAHQILGTVFDLEELAVATGLSLEAVLRMTLRSPLSAMLGRTARALGQRPEFRVCPGCVVPKRRLLTVMSALPLVESCLEHGLILQTRCPCGRDLVAFGPPVGPFECECGRPWHRLPRLATTPQQLYTQRRVQTAYRDLIADPIPDLARAARRLVEVTPDVQRWHGGFDSPLFWPPGVGPRQTFESLASVVGMLLVHNLPATRLRAALDEDPRSKLHACLNRTCRARRELIRRNGVRGGQVETYCSVCGSRFLGGRIILSFDFGHGDPHLSRRAVQHARARLVRWRTALYRAGREFAIAHPGEEPRMDVLFRDAHVPDAGYLRAHRLRLTRVAKAAVHDWGPEQYPYDRYATLDARWRPPSGSRDPDAD